MGLKSQKGVAIMATKTTRKTASVRTKVPTIAADIARLGQIADLNRPLNAELARLKKERDAIIARLSEAVDFTDEDGHKHVVRHTGDAWEVEIEGEKIPADNIKLMRQELGDDLISKYVVPTHQTRWYVHNDARL